MGEASLWVTLGSRLFSHVSARLAPRQNLQGWRDTCQSGSPPSVANKRALVTHRALPFEDEDDDEHDYESVLISLLHPSYADFRLYPGKLTIASSDSFSLSGSKSLNPMPRR
jgi:hypothetical protein